MSDILGHGTKAVIEGTGWTSEYFLTEEQAYDFITKKKANGKIIFVNNDLGAVYYEPSKGSYVVFTKEAERSE